MATGFSYGFGLFETIRFTDGRLSFWEGHWDRLRSSAKALGLHFRFEEVDVIKAISTLVEKDALLSAMVKLSLVRTQNGECLFVYARPRNVMADRISLILDERFPLNPKSLITGHKTHNYLENFALLEQAKEQGYQDMIRISLTGHLAETTMCNLFFYDGERLCTPSLDQGILPGVVRAQILSLVDVDQGAYDPVVLESADAVFMTNSGAGILPVDRITVFGRDFQYNSRRNSTMLKLVDTLAKLERNTAILVE